MTVLKPGDAIASPVDGVTLTGIGYVDGWLHVQVYYADILKTDNHGSISLVNRETGEQIECDGSAAFFDDAGTGSYEDYVFTGIEADALGTYALYGMFVTSTGPVEGAAGADRLCLVTLTEGEANPAPLTGTQFPVLAVSPGLGCLTGRIKAFLL